MSVARAMVPEQVASAATAWDIRSITDAAAYAPSLESALFNALLNQEHLGVGVCGPDGVLTMLNPALEEMLGEKYAPAEQPTWVRRYHFHDELGEPLAAGADPLARALRGETVTGQVVCIRRPRRAPRYMRCSAFQLRDANGDLLAAVVLAVDITDWMAGQVRLDQLRDQLVTAVNHEVRTPLAVIMGHMELIGECQAPVPEALSWSLDAMGRATGHLEEVVNTISQIADESLAVAPRRARRRRSLLRRR